MRTAAAGGKKGEVGEGESGRLGAGEGANEEPVPEVAGLLAGVCEVVGWGVASPRPGAVRCRGGLGPGTRRSGAQAVRGTPLTTSCCCVNAEAIMVELLLLLAGHGLPMPQVSTAAAGCALRLRPVVRGRFLLRAVVLSLSSGRAYSAACPRGHRNWNRQGLEEAGPVISIGALCGDRASQWKPTSVNQSYSSKARSCGAGSRNGSVSGRDAFLSGDGGPPIPKRTSPHSSNMPRSR